MPTKIWVLVDTLATRRLRSWKLVGRDGARVVRLDGGLGGVRGACACVLSRRAKLVFSGEDRGARRRKGGVLCELRAAVRLRLSGPY